MNRLTFSIIFVSAIVIIASIAVFVALNQRLSTGPSTECETITDYGYPETFVYQYTGRNLTTINGRQVFPGGPYTTTSTHIDGTDPAWKGYGDSPQQVIVDCHTYVYKSQTVTSVVVNTQIQTIYTNDTITSYLNSYTITTTTTTLSK